MKKISDPPVESEAPIKKTRPETAGGWGAIKSSLKHADSQMGPTRSVQALGKLNQKDGFDCPGCAWPDPDGERSHFEFCENGVKAVAEEATLKQIGADFFENYSLEQLGEKSDYWLGQQGRFTEPLIKEDGDTHYRAIDWDSAFELIADELRRLNSPDEALFYTSGRTSNEAAFLYQLMVRLYGTNNLPDCSNMCHESSGVALKETLGIGKGSVTLKDFDSADCIIVSGQNPGTNHPRMLSTLQKAARRGCQILVINPLPEAGNTAFIHPQEPWNLLGSGTKLCTLFLQVRINGDVALTQGILKALLADPGEFLDSQFIEKHTLGFDALKVQVEQTPWETIEKSSGISKERIQKAAGILRQSKSIIACWAMGLTQHKNAVANIQQLVNILLLGGHLGRAGAGVCPVRGHSNVQGDRTMGIWERPSAEFLERLGKAVGFQPPTQHGYDTIGAIQAMHQKKATLFFAMGGNFLSAAPDTDFTATALSNCRLTTHVSTKLNRSHLVTGKKALILPCLGRTEVDTQASGDQFVTVENSMGIVHRSQGRLPPISKKLLSEVQIVCRLAQKLFKKQSHPPSLNWKLLGDDYDKIRELIDASIAGFDRYNERVRDEAGFYLPNPVRDSLTFQTETGKAHFTSHPIPEDTLENDQFIMMTIRSHDQYNTTIYGLDDRYRGIQGGRRVVLMNPDDMADWDLEEESKVHLISHFQGQTRKAPDFYVIPYAIPRKSLASYFPEANILVPIDSFAEKSHTPTSKSFVVSLEKTDASKT